ncbi:unnamed protein product [Schistosoma rodhaini]|uniref:Uncharacterized protein n=1 Tax=Schistosoma rodhaini TaxID=6188 RepID=A0AA85GD42_9TREM|nr:unnamed protein product [Schistosoma rodhaini]
MSHEETEREQRKNFVTISYILHSLHYRISKHTNLCITTWCLSVIHLQSIVSHLTYERISVKPSTSKYRSLKCKTSFV